MVKKFQCSDDLERHHEMRKDSIGKNTTGLAGFTVVRDGSGVKVLNWGSSGKPLHGATAII